MRRLKKLLVILTTLGMLVLSANLAWPAELDTAELHGTTNDVTVVQGGSASFTISLSASNQLRCSVTSASPAKATVDTSYAISSTGAVMSGSPSGEFAFFASGTGSGNCPVTWTGAPTPYTVSASVGVALATPVDTYTIVLNDTNGTIAIANPTGDGNALTDNQWTRINVRVVAGADSTPPSVSSITRTAAVDTTNASSVSWTATFNESVTGVDATDFNLANSALGGSPSITSVTGSGASYTVTADTGTGDGSLGLNLVDDDSILDAASNRLGGMGAGNGNFTGQVYAIDHTAPTASSIDRNGSDPTNAASVSWTATFSEDVTGVDTADFALANTGLSGTPAITSVTGAGTTWTVTASSGAGTGTLGLNLADDDTLSDAAGNKLGGTGTGNGNFTGQVYAIDHTAPGVVSINRNNSSPTNASSVSWTATFSESVSGVDAADFALTSTGAVSGRAITSVAGADASYTVTAVTGSGDGTIGLNVIDNDSVHDGVGNELGGTGTGNGNATGQTYTIDKTPPDVSAPDLDAVSDSGASNSDNITKETALSFRGIAEAGSAVELLRDGTVVDTGTATDGTWTLTDAGPVAQGAHTYTSRATDTVGNVSTEASLSVTVDTTAPVIGRHSDDDACTVAGTNGWCKGTQTAGFTATDNVSGFGSGLSYDFTKSTSTEGSDVTIPSGTVTDLAGNTGSSINGGPFKIDGTAPVISLRAGGDGCDAPGTNGWCKGTQTAGFTATDNVSGFGSGLSDDFTKSTSTEGSDVTIPSGTVTDLAGNTGSSINAGPFKIDGTDPTVEITSPATDPYTWASNIQISGTASDAAGGSGLDGVMVGGVPAGLVGGNYTAANVPLNCGVNTLTATASDVAGRTGTDSITVSRRCATVGFLSPIDGSTGGTSAVTKIVRNTGKNGRVIPIKVELTEMPGSELTGADLGAGSVTIRVARLAGSVGAAGTDPVETYADAGQSSAGTNQFRWVSDGSGYWMYNLDTAALKLITGTDYRIDVLINGTVVSTAQFAIFQPTK